MILLVYSKLKKILVLSFPKYDPKFYLFCFYLNMKQQYDFSLFHFLLKI